MDVEKPNESLVLDVPEAAVLLNLSRANAYALVNQGVIPSIRFGKRIVVPRAALLKMLEDVERPKEN